MQAILTGATGAVGSNLLRELLDSPAWTRVTSLVRRPSGVVHPKLDERVVSMDALESAVTPADAAFCTLGVGQPRKVSREEHWKVDVDYVTAFARGCKAAGVRHFSLLTSVGADSTARSRYLRVKGEVEARVRDLGFERTSFLRPSLLVTAEIRYGLQDRLTQAVFPRVSWLLPDRFREIRVEDLALAMRLNAERPATARVETLEHHDFVTLTKR